MHLQTVKAAARSSGASHLSSLSDFFQGVVENRELLLLDDYHNIHTKHRPEAKTQTQVIHMSTLLVKTFPNVDAVSTDTAQTLHSVNPVDVDLLCSIIEEKSVLSKSLSTNMPDWAVAKYFDPEVERHRLLLHDYQQTEITKMRCMENIIVSQLFQGEPSGIQTGFR